VKKKILSLLIAVCLFVPCFLFAACSSSEIGVYMMYSIKSNDVSLTKAEYDRKMVNDDFTDEERNIAFAFSVFKSIELKEDGKCVINLLDFSDEDGRIVAHPGTWTRDRGKITIDPETDEIETMEATYVRGRLTITDVTDDEVMTIVFAK